MEHSTPRESDPIDGATIRRRPLAAVPAPTARDVETMVVAPPALRPLVEDRTVAWEERLAADLRDHDAAGRRRREAAILRRLNRPHRRIVRWLRSWRG